MFAKTLPPAIHAFSVLAVLKSLASCRLLICAQLNSRGWKAFIYKSNPLKRCIQGLVQRMGLYHRLQASVLFDLYGTIANKQWIIEQRKQRTREIGFYLGLIRDFKKGDLIFDIGANGGLKSDVFLRMGAKVVAVEPDDLCQSVLKKKFLWARLVKKPVVVIGKAVSDKCAVETMWILSPGSGMNTLNQKWIESLRMDTSRFGEVDFREKKIVETTTIDKLIDDYGMPVFIKIDVEGYEDRALHGLHRAVPMLSFEVNLPEFRREGLECIHQLARLHMDGSFNYAVDCGKGLVHDDWLREREFLRIFDVCQEKTIEVFWKTSKVRPS
jgi:FkbM family methyltransferase